MPTIAALSNVIRKRFEEQIVDGYDTTLYVLHDNAPEDSARKPPHDKVWCRVSVILGDNKRPEVGGGANKTYRRIGMMVVQIFGPIGRGTKMLDDLADEIESKFRSVVDTAVWFSTPSTLPGRRDGPWWNINVNCPFRADTTS